MPLKRFKFLQQQLSSSRTQSASIYWCWSKRLNFPTMLLKCALVQFWIAVLSSSGRLARLNIHFCPRSPLIWFQPQGHRRMLNACSAYVATDDGQAEQNGKKPWTSRISQNELEVHLIMWTRWAVVECFILTADDSERMTMIMMTTTITSNSVSVLYTALLLLLVSNSK